MAQHKAVTLEARIQQMLNRHDYIVCWPWNGYIGKQGYGRIGKVGARKMAHRFFYEILMGPLPADTVLHHLCGNKRCCNPRHLQQVTPSEHNKIEPRGCAKPGLRVTHCLRGHLYDERNTGYNRGKRHCRKCRVIWEQQYQIRKGARIQ